MEGDARGPVPDFGDRKGGWGDEEDDAGKPASAAAGGAKAAPAKAARLLSARRLATARRRRSRSSCLAIEHSSTCGAGALGPRSPAPAIGYGRQPTVGGEPSAFSFAET